MRILSSSEIMQTNGGFSLGSVLQSATSGAIVGGFVGLIAPGGVIMGACIGATTFGTLNILYQIADSIDKSNGVYYQDRYYYY